MGFYKGFVDAFELHGREVYLTGESYGGYYVPYVANEFLKAANTTYYNLKGISIIDPIIGDSTLQEAVPLVPFVNFWSNVLNLNETFMQQLNAVNDRCNYTTYYDEYFRFPPPPGPFPLLPDHGSNGGCDTFELIYAAAQEANPCFNVYHILDTCPFRYSVLGIVNRGDYSPPGATIYFNRTDVKMALHAPLESNWEQCSRKNVFGNGTRKGSDGSLGPAQNNVLSNVIEQTNNTIIGSGDLDFLLPTDGTLLALQNVTWHGIQGFQEPPGETFYVPYHPEPNRGSLSGAGIVGKWRSERGLTFYSVRLAGHGE